MKLPTFDTSACLRLQLGSSLVELHEDYQPRLPGRNEIGTSRRARRTGRLLRVKCNAVWVDFRGIVVILSELLWSCCFRGAVGLPGWCGVHWVASVVK